MRKSRTSHLGGEGGDVGKGEHHTVGLVPNGKLLCDQALPNDEARLRAVFDQLSTRGRLLLVVDQTNTIGALPVTVARACGHDIAYLPGLSMRRIADFYPGQARPMPARPTSSPVALAPCRTRKTRPVPATASAAC